MTKKENQNKEIKKYLVISILFVVSLAMIGLSLSYAYFTLNFKNPEGEDKTIPPNTAANLNVTSTVDDAEAINTKDLALIDEDEISTAAQHVHFTVTNNEDSTIAASYTINIVDMQISKNLLSQYFKWKVVVTHGDTTAESKTTEYTGDFKDEECSTSTDGVKQSEDGKGECHYVLKDAVGEYTPTDAETMLYINQKYVPKTGSDVTKSILELAQIDGLDINKTDDVDFYIWLQNDPDFDQIYLTNGLFSGKLSITAVPKAN